jgi:hypothetical protein
MAQGHQSIKGRTSAKMEFPIPTQCIPVAYFAVSSLFKRTITGTARGGVRLFKTNICRPRLFISLFFSLLRREFCGFSLAVVVLAVLRVIATNIFQGVCLKKKEFV